MKPIILNSLIIFFTSQLYSMNCSEVYTYSSSHQILDFDMVNKIPDISTAIEKEQSDKSTTNNLRLISAEVFYPSEFSLYEQSVKRSIAKANILLGRVHESNPDRIDFKFPNYPLYKYKFSLPYLDSLKSYISILFDPNRKKIIFYKKSFSEEDI